MGLAPWFREQRRHTGRTSDAYSAAVAAQLTIARPAHLARPQRLVPGGLAVQLT